jgi:dipeptidyl aminopeptidase/acylaminoacyl peptidase
MKTVFDVCYNEKTKQYLDIYLPEREDFAVFLYFHGGGLESGDKSGEKILFDYLVSQGIAVVSANYRMYPNANYPDFLIDAADATAWVFENIGNYGKIKGIYVGGSSAGGYISQMLCFDKTWLSKHGIKATDISGFIHDAGQPTCHFNVLRERGIDKRRVIINDSAPLYHIGESEQYPPMLIIVSDNDMQNRYEQTMLLVSTLKHFGHSKNVQLKIMNGRHCAYVNAVDQNGESVFGKIVAAFIEGEV